MLTDFSKILDVKNINFPVKIKDIHKVEKKTALAIFVINIRKNIQLMYQKNVVMLLRRTC